MPSPSRTPDVAAIKGRLDMAESWPTPCANRQRVPAEDRILEVDGRKLTLTPRQVRRARDRARATGKPHNEARVTFVKILLRELTEQLTDLVEAGNIGNNADRSYLAEDVRTARDVRIALNLCWMPMTPEKLISRAVQQARHPRVCTPHLTAGGARAAAAPGRRPLDRSRRAAAGRGRRTARRARSRCRPRTGPAGARPRPRLANAKQTLENMEPAGVDVADVGRGTRGPKPGREAPADRRRARHRDRTWAFGHIVVDEAQELSPMQWRLLVRRCPLKSFTIVGDIAQTSSAAGANSWQGALAPLFGERLALDELTVNYRTPAQIAEAAVRMANAAGLVVSAPKAVREGRGRRSWTRSEPGSVVEPARRGAAGRARRDRRRPAGRDCRRRPLPQRRAALRAARPPRRHRCRQLRAGHRGHLPPGRQGPGVRRRGGPGTARVLNHEHGTVGDLYVAMTRPTQRLR